MTLCCIIDQFANLTLTWNIWNHSSSVLLSGESLRLEELPTDRPRRNVRLAAVPLGGLRKVSGNLLGALLVEHVHKR